MYCLLYLCSKINIADDIASGVCRGIANVRLVNLLCNNKNNKQTFQFKNNNGNDKICVVP